MYKVYLLNESVLVVSVYPLYRKERYRVRRKAYKTWREQTRSSKPEVTGCKEIFPQP